ncbi:MAG: hypothetical protein ABI634_16265, partial [Acidobacteriota bacterium]
MSHKPTVFVGVVLAFGLSLAASAFPLSADRSTTTGVTRTIFASVVGKDGTPVTGLTVADFDVKEGGKAQVLTSVKPATMPLRVHLIVSDGGSGAFQLGALRLVQALAGQAQFAFTSVHVQPERVMDFTDNVDLIGAGIQKLGRRGTPQGGNQLMEAIKGAIEDLGAPGKHPVLIVLRLGNEDASTLSAKTVRESLRMSGATMYVVSRAGASKAAPTFAGGGSMTAAVAQREMDDTELADTARNLNAVL